MPKHSRPDLSRNSCEELLPLAERRQPLKEAVIGSNTLQIPPILVRKQFTQNR